MKILESIQASKEKFWCEWSNYEKYGGNPKTPRNSDQQLKCHQNQSFAPEKEIKGGQTKYNLSRKTKYTRLQNLRGSSKEVNHKEKPPPIMENTSPKSHFKPKLDP